MILLIVPLLFFSIGCDKDEENDPDYSDLILGHWINDSFIENTIVETIHVDPVFGTETTTTTTESETTQSSPFHEPISPFHDTYFTLLYLTYNYDNSWTSTSHYYDDEGLNNFSNEDSWGGTYSINNDQLTLSMNGSIYLDNITILELSNTRMVHRVEDRDTTDIIDDFYYITTRNQTIDFSRISGIPSP